MSGADIDTLMELWDASLTIHDTEGEPPFTGSKDMYAHIDAIQAGDAPWKCGKIKPRFDHLPEDAPLWMTEEYEVWFRDTSVVARNILKNKDFDGQFDYAPFREYDDEGKRQWKNVMSGNHAWDKAVSYLICFNHKFLRPILG